MTMILAGQAAGTLAARRTLSVCRRLADHLAAHLAAAQTRRLLDGLDDGILDDIGIERTDIDGVAERVASALRRRSQ